MPFWLVMGVLVPLGKKEAVEEADFDGLQRVVLRRSDEDVMIARRERRESEVIIKGGMAARKGPSMRTKVDCHDNRGYRGVRTRFENLRGNGGAIGHCKKAVVI